jgi:DNA-binding beta-propeller fold protein YncE
MDRRKFLVAAAAAPFAITRVRPHPPALALVTADLESRIVVVRLSDGAVHSSIRTPGFPRSIETVGGSLAVVAHTDIGTVSILDARALSLTHSLGGFEEPRYTAGHPDGRHAYVTDAERGEVVALDVVRGRALGSTHVGSRARHITIDPTGRALWVALGSKAAEIAVVDVSKPDAPRLVRHFLPPFLAHDVAFAPDGRHAWVSSGNLSELAVYDARRGRVLARPSGDWPPQHITFAGDTAYVTSGWSGTLRLHRVEGRPIRMTPVPVGSYNVQHGSHRVVTAGLGRGSLCILDEQGRLLHQQQVAKSSHDACLIGVP